MIRPFMPYMTKSELHAIMTGGFATVSGSVLGAYTSYGVSKNYSLQSSKTWVDVSNLGQLFFIV